MGKPPTCDPYARLFFNPLQHVGLSRGQHFNATGVNDELLELLGVGVEGGEIGRVH